MSPLVAVDIGNSRIKLALFDRERLDGSAATLARPRATGVIHDPTDLTTDRLVNWHPSLSETPAVGVVATTDPGMLKRFLDCWPSVWSPPRIVENTSDFPLLVTVREPRRVGIDRLLNALAASRIVRMGSPAIIVDSGTATTIDLLAADGSFSGGAILPGLQMGADSLHDYTAALPRVKLPSSGELPHPLGRETESALLSGLLYGHLGAVRELIARLARSLPRESSAPELIVTGGGLNWLRSHLPRVNAYPDLTLQGLVLAWQLGTE